MTTPLPVVAHMREVYSGEPFIYYCLVNAQKYRSIVITREVRNTYNLHFDQVHLTQKFYFLEYKLNRAFKKYFGKPLFIGQRAYKHVLKIWKPVIIHAHFGTDGAFLTPVARAQRIPLVVSFYGYDMSMMARQQQWMERYKTMFQQCAAVIAEGPYMGERLVELGCPSAKLHVIPIGVSIDSVHFTPVQPPENGMRYTALMCCRFDEKKGVLDALRAFFIVSKKYENIELKIIGDGILRQKIEQLISELHLAEKIKLLGIRSVEEFHQALSEAHMFLQPSKTAKNGDSEGGAPTTLIEAQLAGVPIISTYHADIPNIVHHQKAGLLSPEGDYTALAENMIYLMEHSDLWKEFGRYGRQYAEENHDARKVVKQLEHLYDVILHNENAKTII